MSSSVGEKNSKLWLKYFYIRSNLNIECLSDTEIKILKNEVNIDILFKLIEDSLSRVIKVRKYCGNAIREGLIFYDGDSKGHLESKESLILGFDYNIFDVEIDDEKWDDYFIEQTQIIDNMLNQI